MPLLPRTPGIQLDSVENSKRQKLSNRTKFFSVNSAVPLAPVVIYLLNPFPATPNLLRLSNYKFAQKQRQEPIQHEMVILEALG